jgi:hypothetical protein
MAEEKQTSDPINCVAKIGFSKETDNYDKARPTYPIEALERVFEAFGLDNLNEGDESINVLDLAAGTGIFTRLCSLSF